MTDYNIYELLDNKGYKKIYGELYEKKRFSHYSGYPKLTSDERIMFYLSRKCMEFDITWFHFKDRVLRTSKSCIVRSIYMTVREAGI